MKTRWKMRNLITFLIFSILIGVFALHNGASGFDNAGAKSNENNTYFVVHK
jgi:hypothetical protein